METQDVFSDVANMLSQFEEKLVQLLRKSKQQDVQLNKNDELLQRLHLWLSVSDECIKSIERIESTLSPRVRWHPEKTDMLEMVFHSGDSPWSFCLSYILTSEVEDLLKKIELAWRKNELQKIEKPEAGDYICYCDNNIVYRGYIMNTVTKTLVRVMNIDKYLINVVKVSSCYHLRPEFCELPCNIVQCCLSKDKIDANKWNDDLTAIFQCTLRDSHLTVNILDKIDTVPPTFHVELYAFNEACEAEINVSDWFFQKLLPALQGLPEDVKPDNIVTYLDDDIIDPFICMPGINKSTVTETENKSISPAEEPYESCKIPFLLTEPKVSVPFDKKTLHQLEQFVSAEKNMFPENSTASANLIMTIKEEEKVVLKKEPKVQSWINALDFKPEEKVVLKNEPTVESAIKAVDIKPTPCPSTIKSASTSIFEPTQSIQDEGIRSISPAKEPCKSSEIPYLLTEPKGSVPFDKKTLYQLEQLLSAERNIFPENSTSSANLVTTIKEEKVVLNKKPEVESWINAPEFKPEEKVVRKNETTVESVIKAVEFKPNLYPLPIKSVSVSISEPTQSIQEKGIIPTAEEPKSKTAYLLTEPKVSVPFDIETLHQLEQFVSAEKNIFSENSTASAKLLMTIEEEEKVVLKNESTFEAWINAPEFTPQEKLVLKNEPTVESAIKAVDIKPIPCPSTIKSASISKSELTQSIQDLGTIVKHGYNEEPVLPGGYFPTDDQRICAFYVKNSYCWKPGCTKEHKKPASGDKWTDDSEEIFKETINKLPLPKIGTSTNVIVTNVMSANTFYAVLSSSLLEDENEETVESLISQLNRPEYLNSLKLLRVPPSFGQLVVAYSSTKKQWLRASMCDVSNASVNLFQFYFVDLGITEEVAYDKCREITPELIHLPYQAIYCSLADLFVENTEDKNGRSFLEELILNQVLSVEIVDSDLRDTRLEVIAYSLSGFSLNDLMVKRGYCSVFYR